jgi:hypothetical protein
MQFPDARLPYPAGQVRQQPVSVPGGCHAYISGMVAYEPRSPEAHATLYLAVDHMFVSLLVRCRKNLIVLLFSPNNLRSACRGRL